MNKYIPFIKLLKLIWCSFLEMELTMIILDTEDKGVHLTAHPAIGVLAVEVTLYKHISPIIFVVPKATRARRI